jgi:hypothetical protein
VTRSAWVSDDEIRDLGFGAVVSGESRQRLLNRDGSFNVARKGLRLGTSLSLYHTLLTMTWTRFMALVAGSYVLANAGFALAFVLCGPGALSVAGGSGVETVFARAFFFSVETFSTIGYGNVAPATLAANLEKLGPGTWILVEHPGMDVPEMRAQGHLGYETVAADREGVTRAFTSPKALAAVKARGIRLVSYAEVNR